MRRFAKLQEVDGGTSWIVTQFLPGSYEKLKIVINNKENIRREKALKQLIYLKILV